VTRWSNIPIEVRFRTVDGLTVRVAESEARGQHALLLSPWPESLLAYEQLWLPLAEHARLVAIDLPGFGRSEGSDALSSPAAMGDFIVRAADVFGMENPHVLGPGQNTAAVLFAAARHAGRLRSLVVGGGPAAIPLKLGGLLAHCVDCADPDVYCVANPRQIVTDLLAGIQRYTLPDEVRQDYLSCYEGDRLVQSMAYMRTYPSQLPTLHNLLPQISAPVQIIAGRHDQMVPPVNAQVLHHHLPNNTLALLDAGHFVWEDAADEYAALVSSWWAAHRPNINPPR
jgi:pimeloyl-ACP methyl ester carboxylesterase